MKPIGPAVALAVLIALPAATLAQGGKPAAAKPEAAAAQPATAAEPAKEPRRSRAHEDARKCLELPTNMEIHQCAEQYR